MLRIMIHELREEFGDESIKVLLLNVLTSIYPFLEKLGCKISAPLVIIVDSDGMLRKLSEQLCGFSTLHMTPISVTPKELKKDLEEAEYGLSCFCFSDGRYTSYNLETILTECQKGESDISRIKLRIIFAVERVPRKYQHFLGGTIYVKGISGMGKKDVIDNKNFLEKIISFCIGHIPEIKNIEKKVTVGNEDFDTLKVVAESLKLFLELQDLSQEEIGTIKEELDNTLVEIEAKWENAEEPGTYAVAFRRALYDYAAKITDVFDREHLPGEAIEKLETSLLFDHVFYYLPYALFCGVSEVIEGVENLDYVKAKLVDAGIIIGEGNGRSYYTKKIELVTSYGYIMRQRLVKLPIDRIDIPGGLTLREKIIAEKGGEDNGNQIRKN